MIWRYHGAINPISPSNADQEVDDSMRVEWGKARARAHRWTEETVLLQEEMRRVVAFFEWKARWWRCQAILLLQRIVYLASFSMNTLNDHQRSLHYFILLSNFGLSD